MTITEALAEIKTAQARIAKKRESVRQYVAGATLVGAVALMTALCVWALAPETMGAGQTPMVQAMFSPDG